MSETIRVCALADLNRTKPTRVDIDGIGALAVFPSAGNFVVVDDRCPHVGSSLSKEAWLEDNMLECGGHNCVFDVRTGHSRTRHCADAMLTVYKSHCRDGALFIEP